jgi:hypothetical protein
LIFHSPTGGKTLNMTLREYIEKQKKHLDAVLKTTERLHRESPEAFSSPDAEESEAFLKHVVDYLIVDPIAEDTNQP